jgi:Tfp pilus assembly protein FimT
MTNKKGFSLLEILIYVAVIAIVTLSIGSVLISLSKGQSRIDSKSEVTANIRFALEKINQDLLSAYSVSVPAAASTSSSTLKMTILGSTVTYCVLNGQLRRASGGAACDATSELITTDKVIVSNITFTRLENTNIVLLKTVASIQTNITVMYNSASPDLQYTGSKITTASLR